MGRIDLLKVLPALIWIVGAFSILLGAILFMQENSDAIGVLIIALMLFAIWSGIGMLTALPNDKERRVD